MSELADVLVKEHHAALPQEACGFCIKDVGPIIVEKCMLGVRVDKKLHFDLASFECGLQGRRCVWSEKIVQARRVNLCGR